MMIDTYAAFLKDSKNMSPNTIEAYRRDVAAFEAYLRTNGTGDLTEATNADVVAYMLDLKNEGKSRSTVNRRLASLRSFYAFLQNQGVLGENPTESIRSPKIARKDIEYLSEEEVVRLLETPDDSVIGIRDRAMLETLYATGVRVSELIEIRLEDLNLHMGFVALNGRHGRARIVPLGVPARDALREYLESSRKVLMKDGDPEDPKKVLFVNYVGEPFSRQGFWKTLKAYGKKAGLEDRLTPQTLRNSFAMHMVQHGIDIRSLQELMGHEDITATEVYFGDATTRIKDVYDRTHPRAR